MISRRSIPNALHIFKNSLQISKENLVTESEKWSEPQTNLIKKIIKQGGTTIINGDRYNFTRFLNVQDQSKDTGIEIDIIEE